jgi:hypothetical protein
MVGPARTIASPTSIALHDAICGIDRVDRDRGMLVFPEDRRIVLTGWEVMGDAGDIRSRNAVGSRKLNSESGGTGLDSRRVPWR